MRVVHALLACAVAACLGPVIDEGDGASDVWGADDRVERYAVRGNAWFDAARASAAMVPPHMISRADDGTYQTRRPTLGTSYNLCSTEKFIDQPAVATCSATLIAPDLVLTAGHCLTTCDESRFVFDFAYEQAGVAPMAVTQRIPANNVYACRQVVAHKNQGVQDYALVRLDRPVTGRAYAKLYVGNDLPRDTTLAAIGHPSGIPQKIARGAVTSADFRDATSLDADTFGGNSGGGVFTEDGKLVGAVAKNSLSNPYIANGSCNVAAVCGVNADCFFRTSAYNAAAWLFEIPTALRDELLAAQR